jgi:hypothetical protein
MTYSRLPLDEFKTLYPLPALTEPQYAAWSTKAEARVGENYGSEQQDATELLTAHLLVTNGIGASAASAVLSATGATSFKSGDFSATISESIVSARAKGGYGSTPYGQQFAAIQRRLFGGPVLVGYTGALC